MGAVQVAPKLLFGDLLRQLERADGSGRATLEQLILLLSHHRGHADPPPGLLTLGKESQLAVADLQRVPCLQDMVDHLGIVDPGTVSATQVLNHEAIFCPYHAGMLS